MKHVIMGTAGHVDHGKTCLIKALTGTDTDRLKEEKQRGITIELGFARLSGSEDLEIGIVDVPGHEKFVRHMLAGASGIDMVLFVIAADEGMMPQTVEHLEILKMLHIEKGIIALTKIDLVEEEWLEMVKEDVRESTKGTFLENAELIEVSSQTGYQIDYLRARICEMAEACSLRREEEELLRIPVDRVFTIDGFGTVVTGTLTEGSIKTGEEIWIYPSERKVKVRNLQVHGKPVKQATAGQRTAVNLAGIKKVDVRRGEVLAAPFSMEKSRMLDVRVSMFDTAKRPLENGARLHLFYGSAEVLCKAVLLDADILQQGQSGFAQLRLEEDIAVKRGDRFILRFYSPLESIAGGVVLDPVAPKRKRFQETALDALKRKDEGSGKEVLEQILLEESQKFPQERLLARKWGGLRTEAAELLREMEELGTAYRIDKDVYLHRDFLRTVQTTAEQILEDYHEKNPVSGGMVREELRVRLKNGLHASDMKPMDALIAGMIDRGILKEAGNTVALSGFSIQYTEEQRQIRDAIEEIYQKAGVEIPESEEVIDGFKDKALARQMIERLCGEGVLVKLEYPNYMHSETIGWARQILKETIAEKGQITLAEYRDKIETSRKYAMMILEYFDREHITKKNGDARVLWE